MFSKFSRWLRSRLSHPVDKVSFGDREGNFLRIEKWSDGSLTWVLKGESIRLERDALVKLSRFLEGE